MEDTETKWHLDKKVPISIILVLAMQFIGGLWVVADIKKDVEVLKAGLVTQHERDDRQDRQDRQGSEALTLVRNDILDVGRKLDRLIERKK